MSVAYFLFQDEKNEVPKRKTIFPYNKFEIIFFLFLFCFLSTEKFIMVS